jgi:serine/threonine-protein kinase
MSGIPDRLTAALADRYRIERELGAGGMATVYLAQDLKHDRRVAIKVLRPELAAVIGAERFLSEIKTTANLQHPHILPLFDSGAADSFLFYVMPFIEGESLRDRLNREKQLPITDAVRIATEVASALDYAHRHNVIHRDIKPENILLHDGRALVADFGIALAASKAGGTRMTETGMSLGTPTYMSPEQAMGEREITARSDVYALGAMTYEMLLGEPPFTGPTAQAIVAKVMTAEPASLSATRKSVSPAVEDAVLTALEKLPADRFASAAEFAVALGGHGTMSPRRRRVEERVRARGLLAIWGVPVVALATTLAAFLAGRAGRTLSGPSVFDAALPDSAPMSFAAATSTTAYGNSTRNIEVSRAGDFAVYAAREGDSSSLWYRSLRDGNVHRIPGTHDAVAPRISPDGSQVVFLVGDRFMVAPTAGGEARRLLDGKSASVVEWLSPTEVLAIDQDGNRMSWLDPQGGTARSKPIARCSDGTWVPKLKRLLCSFNWTAQLVDPETGERVRIMSTRPDGTTGGPLAGTAFRLVDAEYLVFMSADGLLAAAHFDQATHRAGRTVTMVPGVRREALGEAQYDLSADGQLVYAPGVDATVGRMVKLRPGAAPEPLPVESGDFQRYDLSRDRRWLAAVVQAAEATELRIYDLRDGQHFTWLKGEAIRHPLWSPSGEQLLLGMRDSTQWHILRGAPSSGVRPDIVSELVVDVGNPDPADFHDDHLAVAQDWAASIVLRFDPGTRNPKLDTVLAGGRFASLSPNGRLLAYQTLEESRVVVTSFPVPGRRWQLSSEGVEPLWLSATEVLFRSGVSWYLVRLNPETGEPVGAPTFWARDPRFSDTSGWSNRLSHDGGIIYVQGPEQTSAAYLRVVPNWVAQMKAAVDKAN